MAANPAETAPQTETTSPTQVCVEWLGARPAWLELPTAVEALERHGVLERDDLDLDLARRVASPDRSSTTVLHVQAADGIAFRALRRSGMYDVLTVDRSGLASVPNRAEARRLNDADLVLIGSVGALRETRRRYPFLAAKTALFRSPADFAPHDAAQLGGKPARVIFEGPLTRAGGLDLVVEALARLGSVTPELLVLASGGREKRYLAWCQRRASETGLRLTIASASERAAARDAYASATVVCAPYRDAIMSEPAHRAAAAGIPIVATEVDTLLELVEDGVTGYIVPIDDILGLARRLELLLRDEELRGDFGRAARMRAEAELSPAAAVSRLVGLWSGAARRAAHAALA